MTANVTAYLPLLVMVPSASDMVPTRVTFGNALTHRQSILLAMMPRHVPVTCQLRFFDLQVALRENPSVQKAVHKPAAKNRKGESKITSPAIASPAIVRAETNFLRFPFFALSTKNIHNIDFREVHGTRKVKTEAGESTVDFSYRVSRNTDHVFPGQLSRKIHFALLAIMAKQGPVPENPVRFTWRQLAREMGVSYGGGKMIREMKDAIRSTHGTIIRTDQALIDGTMDDRPTLKRERGLHLYDDYLFQDETLADGTTKDRNEVTFADWYFNNLKARYIQPLDFDLWLRLNAKTPIASRLYEYLVFVFGKNNFRRISYRKLAASIPLTEVTSLSRKKTQLEPALKALKDEQVLKRSTWTTGKYGDTIIQFERGESLKANTSSLATENPDDEVTVSTAESHNAVSPTDRIIIEYYKKRFGSDHLVTEKERKFIRPLIDRYGLEELQSKLSRVVRRMKSEFAAGATILAAKSIFEQELSVSRKAQDTEQLSNRMNPIRSKTKSKFKSNGKIEKRNFKLSGNHFNFRSKIRSRIDRQKSLGQKIKLDRIPNDGPARSKSSFL